MKTISLPSSLTYIGPYAFESCVSLESVYFGYNSLLSEIAENAFYNCRKLNNIIFPESLEYIGHAAFQGCIGLQSVTIPNSVTYLAEAAFVSCYSLESVVVPSSVTAIYEHTFGFCYSLETVYIERPSWVDMTELCGRYIFSGCDLTTIYVPDADSLISYQIHGWPEYASIMEVQPFAFELIDNCTAYRLTGMRDTDAMPDVIIPSEYNGLPVTEIGYGAFAMNYDMLSVTIPSSIRYIDGCAFIFCENLEVINVDRPINKGDISMGIHALEFTYSLEAIRFPDADTAEYYRTAPEWMYYSSIFKSPTFTYGTSLYGNGLAVIGVDYMLSDVIIPAMYDGVPVTELGYGVPAGYGFFTSITLPSSIEYLPNYCLASQTLKEVYIERPFWQGIIALSNDTFYNAVELEAIYLPDYATLDAYMQDPQWSMYSSILSVR